jgi:hypothetical protein
VVLIRSCQGSGGGARQRHREGAADGPVVDENVGVTEIDADPGSNLVAEPGGQPVAVLIGMRAVRNRSWTGL